MNVFCEVSIIPHPCCVFPALRAFLGWCSCVLAEHKDFMHFFTTTNLSHNKCIVTHFYTEEQPNEGLIQLDHSSVTSQLMTIILPFDTSISAFLVIILFVTNWLEACPFNTSLIRSKGHFFVAYFISVIQYTHLLRHCHVTHIIQLEWHSIEHLSLQKHHIPPN